MQFSHLFWDGRSICLWVVYSTNTRVLEDQWIAYLRLLCSFAEQPSFLLCYMQNASDLPLPLPPTYAFTTNESTLYFLDHRFWPALSMSMHQHSIDYRFQICLQIHKFLVRRHKIRNPLQLNLVLESATPWKQWSLKIQYERPKGKIYCAQNLTPKISGPFW
jgi:hypothetical protein